MRRLIRRIRFMLRDFMMPEVVRRQLVEHSAFYFAYIRELKFSRVSRWQWQFDDLAERIEARYTCFTFPAIDREIERWKSGQLPQQGDNA